MTKTELEKETDNILLTIEYYKENLQEQNFWYRILEETKRELSQCR